MCGETTVTKANNIEKKKDQTCLSNTYKYDYNSCEKPLIEKNDDQHIIKRNFAAATVALCLCTLTNTYLLLSVFPYAGYMTIHLVPGINNENAGLKAGFIASSFMFGRILSSFHWGKVADTYGRKATLVISLFMLSIFSLIFGQSTCFEYALISRFLLGVCSALNGIVKTVVTEIALGDEALESKATGIVIGMRSWGFLISPALGGFLADPLKQYPDSLLVHRFKPYLSTYPFALPNILGTCLCLGAMLATILYLEETLPDDKLRRLDQIPQDLQKYLKKCLKCATCGTETSHDIEEGDSNCLVNKQSNKQGDKELILFFWTNKRTRLLFEIYWIFSFLSCGIDEVFPLFCMSSAAGLGLSANSIGKILAFSGILFAMSQYIVYKTTVELFTLYTSLKVAVVFGIFSVLLIPLSVTLNGGGALGELNWTATFFLVMILAIQKTFVCVFVALTTIATNKTVPAEYRGTMNGFNLVGTSLFKALGPVLFASTFAYLISSGIVSPLSGAILTFTFISSFGVLILLSINELSFQASEENHI